MAALPSQPFAKENEQIMSASESGQDNSQVDFDLNGVRSDEQENDYDSQSQTGSETSYDDGPDITRVLERLAAAKNGSVLLNNTSSLKQGLI